MTQAQKPLKAVRSGAVGLELLAEAKRAEDLIGMLRNALPAEKAAALRTSSHRFAKLMMVTALVCQVLHRASTLSLNSWSSGPSQYRRRRIAIIECSGVLE